MSLEQLRAKADSIDMLFGIGRRTAQLIRDELARITPPDES